jgi:hypothetical protein
MQLLEQARVSVADPLRALRHGGHVRIAPCLPDLGSKSSAVGDSNPDAACPCTNFARAWLGRRECGCGLGAVGSRCRCAR